jgi:D-alanine-D-alanine ligase
MKSKRIGVVMGGAPSARETSIRCGRAVAFALEQAGHEVCEIELNPAQDLAEPLRRSNIDVAFLALQGRLGEGGCVQGLLELLQIPYTGSGVLQSALAMDKLKSKELFRLHNVPTPAYYVIPSHISREQLLETHGSFGYPAVVKPRREGGSVGVSRVNNAEELVKAVRAANAFDTEVLVERYIRGCEITVALLNGRVLGALEVASPTEIFDFAAKQQPNNVAYREPHALTPALQKNVLALAERAASALDVTGAVRVDMKVTENQNEYVLEVNTLPSLAEGSPFLRIAESAGYSLADLCESLLERAELGMKLPVAAKKATILPLNKAEEPGLRVAAG